MHRLPQAYRCHHKPILTELIWKRTKPSVQKRTPNNSQHFARAVLISMQCYVWPWLIELSGVALSCFTIIFWPWLIQFSCVAPSCFTLSRLAIVSGCSAHNTGRHVQPTVQGSSLFNAMGQENREYFKPLKHAEVIVS